MTRYGDIFKLVEFDHTMFEYAFSMVVYENELDLVNTQ